MGILDFTKTVVTSPDGTKTAYANPLDALKAQSIASEGTLPTTGQTINETIPSVALPQYDPSASIANTPLPPTVAAPVPDDPSMPPYNAAPVAAAAPLPVTPAVDTSTDSAQPPPTTYTNTPDVTGAPSIRGPIVTKGQILQSVLQLAMGGAAGAGQRTIGAGMQQAMMLPIDIRKAGAQADQAASQAALTNEEVTSLPQTTAAKIAMQNADLGLKNAEASFYQQGKNFGTPEVRAAFIQANPQFFANDTEKSNYALYGSKLPKESVADTVEGRLRLMAAHPELTQSLSPEQQAQLAWHGNFTNPTEHNTSPAQLALDAATNPDPVQRAASAKALSLFGNATRPNNTPGNQSSADDLNAAAEGEATQWVGQAMTNAKNDPAKAVAILDHAATAPGLTPANLRAIGKARAQLAKSVPKAATGPAALLQHLGVMPPPVQ